MKQYLLLFIFLFTGISLNVHAQTPVDTTFQLPDIYVRGKISPLVNDGELKELQVERNPVYVNATTAEALRSIPSLVTDMEGDVTYRGSSRVNTLIRGVPYGWMEEYNGDILIQLPAGFFNYISLSSYPQINLIPDGEGGILNLGSSTYSPNDPLLQLFAGAGWYERYNAGVILNKHVEKFYVSARYNYRREYRKRTFRKLTTTPTGSTEMNNNADARPDIHLADLTLGYHINPGNEISFYGLYHRMEYDRYGRIHNTQRNPAGEVTNNIFRHRYNTQMQDAIAAEGRWKHTFSDPSGHLEFIFSYDNFGYDEDNTYKNEKPETGAILAEDDAYVTHDKNNFYFSGVFRKDFTSGWHVITGYTGRVKNEDYSTFANNKVDGTWVPNAAKSDRFEFDRQTHMIFGSVEKQFGQFNAGAGLQAEYSRQKVKEGTTNDHFHLYPRVHLTYLINPFHQLNVSYIQRTVRPVGSDLNPFINNSDATHIVQGNPELEQEFIHSLELSYDFSASQYRLTPTLYYRHRSNRIMEIAREEESQTIWRKDNVGTSRIVGFELATKWNPIRRIVIGLAGNVYRDEIDGQAIGYDAKKNMVCGDIKGSLQWNLTPSTEFQADAFYVSDQLTPQGKVKSHYSVNAGLTQYFMDRKLRANLSIQNIFDSLEEVTIIDTEKLQMRQERNRDARVAWLSISYQL